jgi:hypothetical protein
VGGTDPSLTLLAERLGARRAVLDDAALSAIRDAYPRVEGALGEALFAAAVKETTGLLIRALEGHAEDARRDVEPLAERVGRASAEAGLRLDDVTGPASLYQRAAWDAVAAIVADLTLTADAAMHVGLSSFLFADAYSRVAVEAYVAADAARGAALLYARQMLLAELLGGHADPRALAPRAEACGWHLPDVASVAIALDDQPAWPAGALAGAWGDTAVALLPYGAPAGLPAACGPPVALSELPDSLDSAHRLAALARDGRAGPGRPVAWEEHLLELVLTGDRRAAEAFAAGELACLDAAPPRQRTWLADTLGAWLDHPGSPTKIGAALHLHPQSTRYRLAILRDVLGPALDDPRARFRLRLAIEIRRRTSQPPRR